MAQRRANALGPAPGGYVLMQRDTLQLVLANGVSTGALKFAATALPIPAAAEDPSTEPVPLLAEYAATWLESIRGLVRPRTYEGYAYRLPGSGPPTFRGWG